MKIYLIIMWILTCINSNCSSNSSRAANDLSEARRVNCNQQPNPLAVDEAQRSNRKLIPIENFLLTKVFGRNGIKEPTLSDIEIGRPYTAKQHDWIYLVQEPRDNQTIVYVIRRNNHRDQFFTAFNSTDEARKFIIKNLNPKCSYICCC